VNKEYALSKQNINLNRFSSLSSFFLLSSLSSFFLLFSFFSFFSSPISVFIVRQLSGTLSGFFAY